MILPPDHATAANRVEWTSQKVMLSVDGVMRIYGRCDKG